MRKHVKKGISAICVAVFLVVTMSTCSPLFWVKKYRDMPDVGDLNALTLDDRVTIMEKNADIEKYYQNHYGKRYKRKFLAKPIEVEASRFVSWHDADVAVVPLSDHPQLGVKLTFIHFSDVQLRDEQVRLYGKETSKLADYIISSFEHGPLQET